jgi:hypothetical protein
MHPAAALRHPSANGLLSRSCLGPLLVGLLLSVALAAGAAPPPASPSASSAARADLKDKDRQTIPPAPAVRAGALPASVTKALPSLRKTLNQGQFPIAFVKIVGDSGDARMAWYLHDLMRFVSNPAVEQEVASAFEKITKQPLPENHYTAMGDRLLAWDLPAPPGYRELKRDFYVLIEPRWRPFFDDEKSSVDWRQVGWGGVFIDDRLDATKGEPCPRGCIPALDQPKTTSAAEGSWYPDQAIVFGVVINGQARAYPKHMMEVHEMVNDTLGGRQIGMPYCTLCRSVQAYFTDQVTGFKPLLRTSGLLSRSNKFMYDRSTFSAIDTFTGKAISGPLHRAGVVLPQTTVVIATWAQWRKAYPNTTILAQDGGIGRSYSLNPLRGRDDNGPIFPVGDVDPRQAVHEVVLGVTSPDGQALAFPRASVQVALKAGEKVSLRGVTVRADADGLRAFAGDTELLSQEAFWFAWSQFKPRTLLWERGR